MRCFLGWQVPIIDNIFLILARLKVAIDESPYALGTKTETCP